MNIIGLLLIGVGAAVALMSGMFSRIGKRSLNMFDKYNKDDKINVDDSDDSDIEMVLAGLNIGFKVVGLIIAIVGFIIYMR